MIVYILKNIFPQKFCIKYMSLYSMFEYIHSSFPGRKRSPEYPIFSEIKSSLKLVVVFEIFEGMVGFEYIHSSFPDQKRSPEYPIFSEMKSSLKLVVILELFEGVVGS